MVLLQFPIWLRTEKVARRSAGVRSLYSIPFIQLFLGLGDPALLPVHSVCFRRMAGNTLRLPEFVSRWRRVVFAEFLDYNASHWHRFHCYEFCNQFSQQCSGSCVLSKGKRYQLTNNVSYAPDGDLQILKSLSPISVILLSTAIHGDPIPLEKLPPVSYLTDYAGLFQVKTKSHFLSINHPCAGFHGHSRCCIDDL